MLFLSRKKFDSTQLKSLHLGRGQKCENMLNFLTPPSNGKLKLPEHEMENLEMKLPETFAKGEDHMTGLCRSSLSLLWKVSQL